jgi:imidazoleglycerol phosphate dehydratase HisB
MKKILLVDFEALYKQGEPVEGVLLQPGCIRYLTKIYTGLNMQLVAINENALSPEAANFIVRLFGNEGVVITTGALQVPTGTVLTAVAAGAAAQNIATAYGAAVIDFTGAPYNGNWQQVYNALAGTSRAVKHRRTTRETDIYVQLNPDGSGEASIATGLHFFDHMLDQLARHGLLDITIKASGDLQVDEHHTIEDTAITLGEAMLMALGDKRGMERYGFCLPMDDALAQVAVDFGGRSYIVWDAAFKRERIGDVPTEMFFHFFKSFSDAAKCNINIKAEGENEHHKIEAIFKAFARAIKMAVRRDTENLQLPTTKGVL